MPFQACFTAPHPKHCSASSTEAANGTAHERVQVYVEHIPHVQALLQKSTDILSLLIDCRLGSDDAAVLLMHSRILDNLQQRRPDLP